MKFLFTVILICFSTFANAETCKNSVIPAIEADKTNGDVISYLNSLKGTVLFSGEDVEGSYCQLKGWYEDRMSFRRLSSRMLAVLIIVLGASLPLITILDQIFKNQKFWIAFIGAAIVIGQGFSQTFQYEESWRNYTIAKLELEGAHRLWQKKVVDASLSAEGLGAAKKATDDFSDSVSKIVIKETTGFFDTLSESVKNLTKKSNGTQ
jgi:hypothetical protein